MLCNATQACGITQDLQSQDAAEPFQTYQQEMKQMLEELYQIQQQTLQQLKQLAYERHQRQQRMKTACSNFEFNLSRRLQNAHVRPRTVVRWVRNAQGQTPAQPEVTLGSLKRLPSAAVNSLLEHYGLATNGTVADRRNRLLDHLGIFT